MPVSFPFRFPPSSPHHPTQKAKRTKQLYRFVLAAAQGVQRSEADGSVARHFDEHSGLRRVPTCPIPSQEQQGDSASTYWSSLKLILVWGQGQKLELKCFCPPPTPKHHHHHWRLTTQCKASFAPSHNIGPSGLALNCPQSLLNFVPAVLAILLYPDKFYSNIYLWGRTTLFGFQAKFYDWICEAKFLRW